MSLYTVAFVSGVALAFVLNDDTKHKTKGGQSMNISAKEIASLPMWPDFTVDQVNRLCREGKLYAYKTSDAPFTPWIIPVDSFAIYISYNPLYRDAFNKIDTTGMRGEDLMLINAIKSRLDMGEKEQSYTIQQLSGIFDKPANQIATWFGVWKPFAFLMKGKSISISQIVNFLEQHPDRLKALQDRHDALLTSSDMTMEQPVRHILMLHTYYKSNGYLI